VADEETLEVRRTLSLSLSLHILYANAAFSKDEAFSSSSSSLGKGIIGFLGDHGESTPPSSLSAWVRGHSQASGASNLLMADGPADTEESVLSSIHYPSCSWG